MPVIEKTNPATPTSEIKRVTQSLITIDKRRYAIVHDEKNAFDLDTFASRYTDYLEKYDFLVGDWGYEQLRLRGFYKDGRLHVNRDQLISTLEDYLAEYCNFGCKFFVLQRLDAPATKARPRRHHRTARGGRPYEEKVTKAVNVKGQRAETTHNTNRRKRRFTIHQQDKQQGNGAKN